jgi:LuxR family maltose regulon positive regulatory protein
VDDYHVAASESSDSLLGLIVATMPRNLTIALATRHYCRASLSRALLDGRLRRIPGSLLRFTKTEARQYLGGGLGPERLHELHASTEGWPAGLRMAQICLPALRKPEQERGDAAEFTRLVWEYFRSELLHTVSGPELELLIDAAILDEFGSEVCYALGQREETAALLAGLVARETFIEPVDSKPGTYRIPVLLRRYLQERGLERGPREVANRHTRAARYLESHGETLPAIHHYLVAGNPSAAATCLEQAYPLHLAVNRGDEFATAHLASIPSSELASFPRLALCRAYLDYKQGLVDHAEHMMRSVALRTADFTKDRPGGDDEQFAIEVSYVETIRDMFSYSAVSSERLLQVEEKITRLQSDPVLAAVTIRSAGMLYTLRGDLDAAERTFLNGLRLLTPDHAPWGLFWLKYHLAALALTRGRLMDVRYQLQAGLKLWRGSFKTYAPYGALARLLLAELDYEADVLTEAQTKLDESLFIVENAGGWFESFAGAYELAALLRVQSKNLHEVEALLARASTDHRIGALLGSFLQVLRLRCYVSCDRYEAAQELVRQHRLRERWESPGVEDELGYRERDLLGLCLVRLAIHRGDLKDAFANLARMQADVVRGGRMRTATKVWLLQATLFHHTGGTAQAANALRQALERGHAQGYRRTFVDEGMLIHSLLSWACNEEPTVLPDYLHGYAQALLRTLSPHPPEDTATLPLLSVRELEVLRELRLGNANKIIARKLDLSEATVKFHVKNIFRKLKVRKRAAAVAEAQRHGLIA